MSQLKVFISSTCYDLKQIRANLFEFISGIGYQPVMSEFDSFPINPDVDTLDNCISNVQSADLFVLILGSRYGYIVNNGASITNTEYVYAKKIGIPTYVFIYKPLIANFPLWKDNPNADFSSVVDSIKVFAFMEELRVKNSNWCFEFDSAQDIIQTLRIQFAHLYKQALDIRKRVKEIEFPDFYDNISAKALNIILKKEELFEAEFFLQVMKDELSKYERLKLDIEYKILTNCSQQIKDVSDFVSWSGIQFATIQHLILSTNQLISEAFVYFYGQPGQPSDLKGLYYVAEAFGRIYKEISVWCINVKSLDVSDDFVLLKDSLAEIPLLTLRSMWSYPGDSLNEIRTVKASLSPNDNFNIDSKLHLSIDENLVEIVLNEIDRLKLNT